MENFHEPSQTDNFTPILPTLEIIVNGKDQNKKETNFLQKMWIERITWEENMTC